MHGLNPPDPSTLCPAALAKYLGVNPFLPEPLLRLRLSRTLGALKADDRLLAAQVRGAACSVRSRQALLAGRGKHASACSLAAPPSATRRVFQGASTLTKQELKAACEARGMRAIGLTPAAYVAQLDNWLKMSVE